MFFYENFFKNFEEKIAKYVMLNNMNFIHEYRAVLVQTIKLYAWAK